MLRELLTANQDLLIERCRDLVAKRSGPALDRPRFAHGIPIFLGQIINTLTMADCDVAASATLHGRELFLQGYTLEQVIRDYGDVCQSVTKLAVETGVAISAEEFHTFNHCLDDAIAAAATEYSLHKSETALTNARADLADSEAALSLARRHTDAAQFRAMHDSLTGLPNRNCSTTA